MVSRRRDGLAWHVMGPWDARKVAEEPPPANLGDGGEMKHETSKALYAYWLGCHRGTGVRATAVRAADLAAILPSLFLIDIEKTDNARFRFRFCGASISTRYGRDLSEEDFLMLWNPTDTTTLKRDLSASAFRSTGMVTGVMGETLGGGVVSLEMLLLPLTGETGTAGAIGSMVRIGGHDETNRVRARVVAQAIRSIRFLPDTRPDFLRASLATAPVASAASFKMPRRYGHLTVVEGGK
jgi:hypothetical protein